MRSGVIVANETTALMIHCHVTEVRALSRERKTKGLLQRRSRGGKQLGFRRLFPFEHFNLDHLYLPHGTIPLICDFPDGYPYVLIDETLSHIVSTIFQAIRFSLLCPDFRGQLSSIRPLHCCLTW